MIASSRIAIHGDELSSTDAALRVAYELAAGENDDTRALREDLVVLIDPMENPDGRERMLAMTTAYEGGVPNPDPDALPYVPAGLTARELQRLHRWATWRFYMRPKMIFKHVFVIRSIGLKQIVNGASILLRQLFRGRL